MSELADNTLSPEIFPIGAESPLSSLVFNKINAAPLTCLRKLQRTSDVPKRANFVVKSAALAHTRAPPDTTLALVNNCDYYNTTSTLYELARTQRRNHCLELKPEINGKLCKACPSLRQSCPRWTRRPARGLRAALRDRSYSRATCTRRRLWIGSSW